MADADAKQPNVRTTRRDTDDYEHLSPLLAEYASLREGDPQRGVLRERLVEGFLPVVEHIAARYRNHGEPLDDLKQAGAIGLIGALDRYDPERGLSFLSFAVPTITGEVRRHFRDKTWTMRVPRALKDLQAPVREAVRVLSSELQRAPRPSEIAAHLGVKVDDVIETLQAQDAYSPASLEAPLGANTTLADTVGELDDALENVENRHTLRSLLDELPPRERKVLILRFFGNLTQTQISAEVGISQMHVSRLLARTLAQLRRDLNAD